MTSVKTASVRGDDNRDRLVAVIVPTLGACLRIEIDDGGLKTRSLRRPGPAGRIPLSCCPPCTREALGSEDLRMKMCSPNTADFNKALQSSAKLQDLPESQAEDGVSINGFSTWRASRFAVLENGFKNGSEGS